MPSLSVSVTRSRKSNCTVWRVSIPNLKTDCVTLEEFLRSRPGRVESQRGNNMHVNVAVTQKMIRRMGGSTAYQRCEEGWEQLFVLNSQRVSIGRLSFHRGRLNAVKCYKRDYMGEICETDRIFLRFEYYLWSKGRLLSLEELAELEAAAKEQVELCLRECEDWRLENPHPTGKKRKSLRGRNVRHVLRDMVQRAAGVLAVF